MAISLSLNTKGAIPKNPFGDTSSGLIGAINKTTGLSKPAPVTQNMTPATPQNVQLGSNKGLLQTHTPTTPVKKITDNSGNTVEFHTPTEKTKSNISSNTPPPNPNPTVPTTPTITSTNPAIQAENVGKAGQQTQNEANTQQRLIESGQVTPLEQQYINRIQTAQGLQNVGSLAPYAEAGMYANDQIPNADALVTNPDLVGRGGATQGLYNKLANIYGSQATQGLLAANTIAGRGATTAGQAYTGAQTQAQRGLGAAQNVLEATLPGQQGTSSQLYNPLEGAQGGNSIISGANRQSVYDLTQQKNQIQSVFNGAEANFKLLVDTAKQGGVNDTSIPAINALQQAVAKGIASSSAVINFQNTLATVRSQYAQILGGGTATVDSQQRAEQAIPPTISLGALQSLEQQLKAEATNRIAGIDNQVNSLTKGNTTSGGTTGGFAETW